MHYIKDYPLLAVRYKLRGVKPIHGARVPSSYVAATFAIDAKYTVDIYSTAAGEHVKVDLYEQGENSGDFNKTINWKLIQQGYLEELKEENYADKLNNDQWTGTSSETENVDSGKEESDSLSPSSFEATVNKKWVELEDITTDTGFNTGSGRSQKKRTNTGRVYMLLIITSITRVGS